MPHNSGLIVPVVVQNDVDSVRTIQVYVIWRREGGARCLQKLFNTLGLEE